MQCYRLRRRRATTQQGHPRPFSVPSPPSGRLAGPLNPHPRHILLSFSLTQGDLRNVSYEDSKYLGGDVAHTHLVKGLDFALLHKAGCGWAAGVVRWGGFAPGGGGCWPRCCTLSKAAATGAVHAVTSAASPAAPSSCPPSNLGCRCARSKRQPSAAAAQAASRMRRRHPHWPSRWRCRALPWHSR